MSAIIATSDLQGRENFPTARGGPPQLLGEVLPTQLADEILPPLSLPSGKIGVLLAGDLYTVPALDKRGGSGDVTNVWHAFGDRYEWVAGVAGNHDTFGPDPRAKPRFSGRLHYLDGDRVTLDGLRIAGLGGIIGDPKRIQRRTEEDYLRALGELLDEPTDVLVMHEGPDAQVKGFPGSTLIRQWIELLPPGLVVRGHSHWKVPFVELDSGVQVLNVDARIVILREAI